MAVQPSLQRTSAAELQMAMEHPAEEFVRRYAVEVFADRERAEVWLEAEAAGGADWKQVLTALIQIDYGVAG